MEEIFADISEQSKISAELIFNNAIKNYHPATAAKILDNYVNCCPNEREQEFANFYFNMRMRQILDESNNVER